MAWKPYETAAARSHNNNNVAQTSSLGAAPASESNEPRDLTTMTITTAETAKTETLRRRVSRSERRDDDGEKPSQKGVA